MARGIWPLGGAWRERKDIMETLPQGRCVACRRDAPRLTEDELAAARSQLPDWNVVERDGVRRLERAFALPDFATALSFTQRIGALAEAEGHHPTIVTEWGHVTVTWWTHKIKGLHRNDAIMAAKTDRVFADLPAPRQRQDTEAATADPDALVTLREITDETAWPILRLKVAPEQENFVASNAISIAQAHFAPHAWFRAIYAGETPVGFIMLHDDAEKKKYFLWRLMIAADRQGKGYGRQAVSRLVEYVKTRPGARELLVSYVPGAGSPRDFYARLGFQETGETMDEEVVMRLPLQLE